MSNTSIKLDPESYRSLIANTILASADMLSGNEKPELTGNMPSIEQAITTYQGISDAILKCDQMITVVIRNLNSAAKIIEEQDQSLARSK